MPACPSNIAVAAAAVQVGYLHLEDPGRLQVVLAALMELVDELDSRGQDQKAA